MSDTGVFRLGKQFFVLFRVITIRNGRSCQIALSFDLVKFLGRAKGEKLLTLEALYIAEIKLQLNTKDEYRSREV